MHGHGHPELAKKLNDKMPMTMDQMFERVKVFIKGEVAVGSVEIVRPSQGDKGYVRPTWSGVPEKSRNRGGPREAQRNIRVYTFYPKKDTFMPLIKNPKVILAVESVSFPEPRPLIKIIKKQNLNKFCDYHEDRGHNPSNCYQLKKQIEEAVASGKLAHLKEIKSEGSLLTVEVRQKSNMNTASETLMSTSGQGLEGRTGMRSLRAVGSTIHSMIKFPTDQGVVTMETSRETMRECENLERYVTTEATLTTNCKLLLADILRENKQVFAWAGSESTAVPRFVMEHQLKMYPLAKPVVYKRRPVASEGRLALKEKVF
nr:hypothetical protein [Tanacetum cinerariifolium]